MSPAAGSGSPRDDGPILATVGGRSERGTASTSVDIHRHTWSILALAGAVFLLIGIVDIALAWLPLRFGDPEWEFGTISTTINNLPVPAIGLALFLASAVAADHRWQTIVGIVVALLLAADLAIMATFYGLAAPLAWQAGSAAVGRAIIGGAILKAVVAMAAYFTFAVISAILGLRALRRV